MFVKLGMCLIVLIGCHATAHAANEGAPGSPAQGTNIVNAQDYYKSGWRVLVGSYSFPVAANDKAADINRRFPGKYQVSVIRIPKALSAFSVQIGAPRSLEEAAELKKQADGDDLAADVVLWRE